jgi:hypothetical protein
VVIAIGDLARAQRADTAGGRTRARRCAPTGGLFVLAPSAAEFGRALAHLHALNANAPRADAAAGGRAPPPQRCYDGSDQEFWRSFYRPLVELPLRYHAHTGLVMNESEWRKVRLIHNIQGFRAVYRRLPGFVRRSVRFFLGDAADGAKLNDGYPMR